MEIYPMECGASSCTLHLPAIKNGKQAYVRLETDFDQECIYNIRWVSEKIYKAEMKAYSEATENDIDGF